MASLFKKLINPLEKMAKNEVNSLINKAENALLGAVSDSLGRLGMSSKSKSAILASLGDSILSGIASEFFGGFSGEVNRTAKRDIIKNTGFTGTGGGDANVDSLDNSGVTGTGTKKSSDYQFPLDLDKYYIAFAFKKYERLSPNKTVKPIELDSIALPLPRDLQEKMEVAYNTGATGLAGNVIDTIGANRDNGIIGATGYAAVYATEKLAEKFGDGLKSALSQYIGATINPVVSVSFESPKLRSHSFSWTFAPNNDAESEAIKNIIKTFKQNALPNFASDTTAVLTYPNMCQIRLYPWAGSSDSYMYDFKTCMIESVSVNYAPDAVVFFNNDAPGFVKLDINVIEVEYFTARDFGVVPDKKALELYGDKVDTAVKAYEQAMTQITPDTSDSGSTSPATPPSQPLPTIGIGITPTEWDVTIRVKLDDNNNAIQNRAGSWYNESTGKEQHGKLTFIPNINDHSTTNASSPMVKKLITSAGGNLNNKPIPNSVASVKTADGNTLFIDNSAGKGNAVLNIAEKTTGAWQNPKAQAGPTGPGQGAVANGPVPK